MSDVKCLYRTSPSQILFCACITDNLWLVSIVRSRHGRPIGVISFRPLSSFCVHSSVLPTEKERSRKRLIDRKCGEIADQPWPDRHLFQYSPPNSSMSDLCLLPLSALPDIVTEGYFQHMVGRHLAVGCLVCFTPPAIDSNQ